MAPSASDGGCAPSASDGGCAPSASDGVRVNLAAVLAGAAKADPRRIPVSVAVELFPGITVEQVTHGTAAQGIDPLQNAGDNAWTIRHDEQGCPWLTSADPSKPHRKLARAISGGCDDWHVMVEGGRHFVGGSCGMMHVEECAAAPITPVLQSRRDAEWASAMAPAMPVMQMPGALLAPGHSAPAVSITPTVVMHCWSCVGAVCLLIMSLAGVHKNRKPVLLCLLSACRRAPILTEPVVVVDYGVLDGDALRRQFA